MDKMQDLSHHCRGSCIWVTAPEDPLKGSPFRRTKIKVTVSDNTGHELFHQKFQDPGYFPEDLH